MPEDPLMIFHKTSIRALCDVFDDSLLVLFKIAYERSGLDASKVAALIKYLDDESCLKPDRIIGDAKPGRLSKEDVRRFSMEFLRAAEEVLGPQGTVALAKILVDKMREFFGDDRIYEIIKEAFSKIATFDVKVEGNVIRMVFKPNMKDAYKYMPMASGIPFPALMVAKATARDKDFKIRRFEHKPNAYCLLEIEIVREFYRS